MGENERYSTTKKKFDLLAPAYSLMYHGVSDTISQQVQAPFQAQTTTARFSITYVIHTPYVLESNPHPFYSFRGLKNQIRIKIASGLDSRSRAGFWKNDGAAVRAVRTIQ